MSLNKNLGRALCSSALALCATLASAAVTTSTDFEAASALGSVTKSMPALANAISAGAEKACVPTHLTISGNAADGSRLFVTALVPQFNAEVRKSAKGPAKLTREQAHEIQRLVDYATQAQKSGEGLPQEAIDQIASRTGLSVQASMVCMSRETVGAQARPGMAKAVNAAGSAEAPGP